jgi:hypothetical protein
VRLFPGLKRTVCEDDHLPLFKADAKKEWFYTSTTPYFILLYLMSTRNIFSLISHMITSLFAASNDANNS